MNNINLKKEITILKTWKGEEFQIDMKYEEFLDFEKNLKENGEDGFNSIKHRRFIKFSSIEDKIGKTLHLELPEPKKENKILTPEEEEENRNKKNEFIKMCLEKTKEKRKKNFINERNLILSKLEKREKYWGMTSTIEQLEELFKLRKKNILNNFNLPNLITGNKQK